MSAETLRKLENLIRLGTIAEVDYPNAKARVKMGEILTDYLPFATLRAGSTVTWSPPTEGEQCLVLSTGGELTNGVILYGIYQQTIPAPSDAPSLHIIKFADGGTVKYDQSTGTLYAIDINALIINAAQKITITCTNITINGDVQLNGSLRSTGDQVAGGISQINHKHGGVMTGGGKTGAPE